MLFTNELISFLQEKKHILRFCSIRQNRIHQKNEIVILFAFK